MFSSLAVDVDEVPAELGLDDGHVSGIVGERGVLEGLHHLSASEPPEVSPVPSGGALGVLGGERGEVLPGIDPPLQVESLLVGVHEDVGTACLSYHEGMERQCVQISCVMLRT